MPCTMDTGHCAKAWLTVGERLRAESPGVIYLVPSQPQGLCVETQSPSPRGGAASGEPLT